MSRAILKDRVAIITGAGQGLGRAIAREFAEEGCAVALFDINPKTVGDTEAELKENGYRVISYALDITDYQVYGKAIGEVVERWAHIDILVNNAAIALYGTILEDSSKTGVSKSRLI